MSARGDNRNNRPTTTRNATDIRRARERARSVVEQSQTEIQAFVASQGVTLLSNDQPGQVNEMVTRIAQRSFREALVSWLEDRRMTTMGRAIRAAFDLMQKAVPGTVDDDAFAGTPTISHNERQLNVELTNVDAGILYNNDGSVAQRTGNRVTRTLRQGFAEGETGRQLSDRVEEVLTDGEDRRTGVSGMTVQSEAEMIAHDSIQDAYMTATTKRYLNNGFRYALYDATLDNKTSNLCRRLDGVVIDMVETPILLPANHPHCRSGIQPILDLDGRQPVDTNDVSGGYFNTIRRNESIRPQVMDTEAEFRPTVLT